jgi:heme-degrading monooxygenase HmoA
MSRLSTLGAIALLAALLGGCTIATPYRPAAPAEGSGAGEAVVIALTEATLRPDRAARAAFWDGVRRVERDLPNQQGLLGHALRRELLGNRAWTMTVWESQEALDRFVTSPVHRAAIRAGDPALAGQRFATVTRPRTAGPLSWTEALDVLAREGQGYR